MYNFLRTLGRKGRCYIETQEKLGVVVVVKSSSNWLPSMGLWVACAFVPDSDVCKLDFRILATVRPTTVYVVQ